MSQIMVSERVKRLRKNPTILFWAKALLNVKMMNIVVTLFYLHRGLTLSQVFFLSIVWSVVNIIVEIPSSYLADKWGRKKTLMLGSIAFVLQVILLFFANNFWIFALSIALLACSYACFSGTDDALIYDTKKELKEEDKSLKALGTYYSAQRIFKIITPVIGVFIAKDLIASQFIIIIAVDLLAALGTLFLITRLEEPHHAMDVAKQEAGVILDAFTLIKNNKGLLRLIINRTVLFICSFILWRYFQKLFVDIGMTVIALGIGWSLFQLAAYIGTRHITHIFKKLPIPSRINMLNVGMVFSIAAFVATWFIWRNPYLLFVWYSGIAFCEVLRWPLFSEISNKISSSYNRATTLSLMNFIKSILDLPLLFIGAILVSGNLIYPYIFAGVLACIVTFAIKLKPHMYKTKSI